jgi:hypothetical protein
MKGSNSLLLLAGCTAWAAALMSPGVCPAQPPRTEGPVLTAQGQYKETVQFFLQDPAAALDPLGSQKGQRLLGKGLGKTSVRSLSCEATKPLCRLGIGASGWDSCLATAEVPGDTAAKLPSCLR